MKVAAIDCGTNSIRLLIAELDEESPSAGLEDLHREMRIVRLGQGVDETKQFHPEALARTFAAAREYARLIESEGVTQIRFAATSATRDAKNRDEFLNGIEEILGVRPEVISGEEEAELSFAGAARVISGDSQNSLVVDLGGGSTEFILGDAGAQTGEKARAAVSIDVGSVRITERHLVSDPPTTEEIDAARRDVRFSIAQAAESIPFEDVDVLVGVAGTVTTVTAHALGLTRYEPEEINGARLTLTQIDGACADLLARSRAERAELGFLHPGRIDVIGGGALIWQEIVHAVSEALAASGHSLRRVTTSEHDILDGLALSIATQLAG